MPEVPYMLDPLKGDLYSFLEEIDDSFVAGDCSARTYYMAIGKAMAYVECRFSFGFIDEATAKSLLEEIYFHYID